MLTTSSQPYIAACCMTHQQPHVSHCLRWRMTCLQHVWELPAATSSVAQPFAWRPHAAVAGCIQGCWELAQHHVLVCRELQDDLEEAVQSKEGDAVQMERQNQVLVHKVAEQQQEIAKRDEQIARANKELQVGCCSAASALGMACGRGAGASRPASGLTAVQPLKIGGG